MIVNPCIIELFIKTQELEKISKMFETEGPPETWDTDLVDKMLDLAEDYGRTHKRVINILGVDETNKQLNIIEKLFNNEVKN